jgi:hypothetical protein
LGKANLNPERAGANPSLGDNLSVGTMSVGTMARQVTSRRIAEN